MYPPCSSSEKNLELHWADYRIGPITELGRLPNRADYRIGPITELGRLPNYLKLVKTCLNWFTLV